MPKRGSDIHTTAALVIAFAFAFEIAIVIAFAFAVRVAFARFRFLLPKPCGSCFGNPWEWQYTLLLDNTNDNLSLMVAAQRTVDALWRGIIVGCVACVIVIVIVIVIVLLL